MQMFSKLSVSGCPFHLFQSIFSISKSDDTNRFWAIDVDYGILKCDWARTFSEMLWHI